MNQILRLLLLALLLLGADIACAADQIFSAEAAIGRFRTACDGELAKAVPAEKMKLINTLREAPFLMVARKSHADIAEFLDPKFAAAIVKDPLYGSHDALEHSTGNVWVLTYGNMTSLTVYLDATSGVVLCVAFVPEG